MQAGSLGELWDLWPLFAALATPTLLRLRAAPLALVLALGIATSLWTQTDWRYGNTDWRAAIERIDTRAGDAPVVAVTPLGTPVAALYLDAPPTSAPIELTAPAPVPLDPAQLPGAALFPAVRSAAG